MNWPKTELSTVHYLFHFFLKRLVRLTTSQVHLISLHSTTFNPNMYEKDPLQFLYVSM